MTIAFDWTDERVDTLKRLYSKGYSASLIMPEIGAPTRNTVIGKIARLGLSRSVPTIARENPRYRSPEEREAARLAEEARVKELPKPKPRTLKVDKTLTREERQEAFVALADKALERFEEVSAPPEDVAVSYSERVTIMELREYMCRWPMGDPTTPEFRFCGARASTGRPYCSYHCGVAYEPPRVRVGEDRKISRGIVA
jgi:GcrA cell cycle regulator